MSKLKRSKRDEVLTREVSVLEQESTFCLSSYFGGKQITVPESLEMMYYLSLCQVYSGEMEY